MEVLEKSSAWLSNFEVLRHLREQKWLRDKIAESIGRPVRAAENVQTVEFEVFKERLISKVLDVGIFGKGSICFNFDSGKDGKVDELSKDSSLDKS